MGKRLLLVRPKADFRGRFSSVSARPPMNLFYLGAFLEQLGHSVRVVDHEFGGFSPERFGKLVSEFSPDFVGVGVSSASEKSSAELCRIARGLGVPTVAGGAYATTCPERVLDITGADFCIVGEAESALEKLLSSRKGKMKRGRRLLASGPLPRKLDRFGFPDRSGKEFRKYDSCFSAGIPKKTAFIMASRGCPYSCTFCISPVIHGRAWRARSVSSVVSEVESCVSAGYRHIQFDDDIFGLSRTWFGEFCREMRKRGLAEKVTWDFSTRADLFTPGIARLAQGAGCAKVCIGAESGSGRVLAGIRKGISPGKIREAFSSAKETGLLTELFLIVGLPGETAADLRETEKLLFEIDPDIPVVNVFAPLPGTVEYRRALREGFVREGAPVRGFFSGESSLSDQPLSGQEVSRFRDSLCRKFYLRPGYLLRTAKRIRSLPELAYYLNAAVSVVA